MNNAIILIETNQKLIVPTRRPKLYSPKYDIIGGSLYITAYEAWWQDIPDPPQWELKSIYDLRLV